MGFGLFILFFFKSFFSNNLILQYCCSHSIVQYFIFIAILAKILFLKEGLSFFGLVFFLDLSLNLFLLHLHKTNKIHFLKNVLKIMKYFLLKCDDYRFYVTDFCDLKKNSVKEKIGALPSDGQSNCKIFNIFMLKDRYTHLFFLLLFYFPFFLLASCEFLFSSIEKQPPPISLNSKNYFLSPPFVSLPVKRGLLPFIVPDRFVLCVLIYLTPPHPPAHYFRRKQISLL